MQRNFSNLSIGSISALRHLLEMEEYGFRIGKQKFFVRSQIKSLVGHRGRFTYSDAHEFLDALEEEIRSNNDKEEDQLPFGTKEDQ